MVGHEELKRRAEKLHTHDWIMLAVIINQLLTTSTQPRNEIENMQMQGRFSAYKQMLQEHPLFKEAKK